MQNVRPDISIIIPAYNEERRIIPTLQETHIYMQNQNLNYEIIVVDDSSTDRTVEVLEKLKSEIRNLSIIRLDKNYGKGYSVRSGMKASSGAARLFMDADGATPISELERLHAVYKAGADVVIASRAMPSAETTVVTSLHRKVLGRVFNLFANLIAAPGIYDTQCGFKLFSARAAESIFSHQKLNGYSFDVELLLLARKLGYTVKEVPVNWHDVPGTKVNVITDGLLMLRDIVYINFLHRNL